MANIIIVGADGSESARRAVRRAAELAAATDATLHVLTAVDRVSEQAVDDGFGTRIITSGEMAEATAADAAREVASITSKVTSAPLAGKPAEALVEEARQLDARLIVVGNRRVQGIGRILGSVATDVAAHAPCDVYIVKTV